MNDARRLGRQGGACGCLVDRGDLSGMVSDTTSQRREAPGSDSKMRGHDAIQFHRFEKDRTKETARAKIGEWDVLTVVGSRGW